MGGGAPVTAITEWAHGTANEWNRERLWMGAAMGYARDLQ